MHTPGDDGPAPDAPDSRVEVYVTTDTSAAPHKADESQALRDVRRARTPMATGSTSPRRNGKRSSSGSRTASSTSMSQATCPDAATALSWAR